MNFFHHLIKQNQNNLKFNISIESQTNPQDKSNINIDNISKIFNKTQTPLHQTSMPIFSPIHTLLNFQNFRRTAKRPKTLKQFKQNIQQKQSPLKKTQTIIPFIQPEFLIKTLFEEHSLTLKINQVKYFSTTKKGLRNFQTLQNQDIIFFQRVANIFKFYGIFDGHGQYGRTVAECSSIYFKSSLKSYEEQFKRQISEKQIVDIVKSCLKKTQIYLHNAKFNQIQYSGTTALIVLITPRSIISFNIGNSRFIIGMKEQTSDKIYDFQVTHDHDLNRLDERLRVKQKGAIIAPLKDQLGQNFGPDRLWNKHQKRPGTFITRALGLACGSKAGIIPDPQVSILSYNKRMKFLVLASDGLWAVQQNDQVVSYLQRYYNQGSLGMGVQSLIQQATTRWKSRTQLMDDISIIAISLGQQN